MKFMFLIFEDPDVRDARTDQDWQALTREFQAYSRDVTAAGKLIDANPLPDEPAPVAVQCRGGAVVSVDGPFAETREHLGGYYILDCADIEDAKAWAGKIPSARTGTIEIRPVGVLPPG
ncbi:MAG: YciI family protein [Alphaproteobacteria bacterium]